MDQGFRRVFCPAKINLFLQITDKYADGYHEILSCAVLLNFGDRLTIRLSDGRNSHDDFLSCDVSTVPIGRENTIFRALKAFRRLYDFPQRVSVHLEKNIPLQSGMGGGSSDAAFFLKHLNRMLANPLSESELRYVLGMISSDSPLFLGSSPCIIRGRGNEIQSLNSAEFQNIKKYKFLIFKPILGVNTSEAYGQLDRRGIKYRRDRIAAESELSSLLNDLRRNGTSSHFSNGFQEMIGAKYLELAIIFRDLLQEFKKHAHLTGSGSACFIPLPTDEDSQPLADYLRATLGDDALIMEAKPLLLN